MILFSNLFSLIAKITQNFILPKYLPINIYADIKTYQLFISISGFLAFGYIDGMLLRYGGKKIEKVNLLEFEKNLSTFKIFQLLVIILLSIIAYIINNKIMIYALITIFFLNIIDYYKCFFQATGEFALYSKILIYSSVLFFILNIFLVFVIKDNDSNLFLKLYTCAQFLVLVFSELLVKYRIKEKKKYFVFSVSDLLSDIKLGFSLMVGLFCFNFMAALDLWFVKFTLTNKIFAYYSFIAGTLGLLSYVISPVSITLYNYFCNCNIFLKNKLIKKNLNVFSVFIVSGAFCIKFIFEVYLVKYYDAYKILFLLFGSNIFLTIIRCFHNNLYKSEKKQGLFLKRIMITLLLGIILNIGFMIFFKTEIGYAIGTLISFIFWYNFSEEDFKKYRNTNDDIYLYTSLVAFIFCGWNFKSYYGLLVYLIFEIFITFILMRESFVYLYNKVKILKNRRIEK